MILAKCSDAGQKHEKAQTTDPIHLVTQFYVPKTGERYEEVKEALRRNVANPAIDTITLVNERLYTEEELGVASSKITQTVNKRRVRFNELFAPRNFGYVVVTNADIFLDETVSNVRKTDLHCSKSVFAQLRYEFRDTPLHECALFGPRADSNDTWILHSKNPLPLQIFNFELGQPGCDNKLNYLFDLLGYAVYNDPAFVRTYHCHRDESPRQYALKPLPPPYMYVAPAKTECKMFGHPTTRLARDMATYDMQLGNSRLAAFLRDRLEKNRPFLVPRVAGIENNAAVQVNHNGSVPKEALLVLKNNAGIWLDTPSARLNFSEWYLKAFQMCDMYASWEPWSLYVRHIQESQNYLQAVAPKEQFSAAVFDIFHYVAGAEPWTHALKGKKLLIISPFVDVIRSRPQGAYPVELFPECTFEYLKPPMTQGDEPNRGWDEEFKAFCADVKKKDFDVALCSCGGYGNPICAFIYTLGKSAVYVGGVLQMYFGLYGSRWLKERKEVLNLFMTNDWLRPDGKPKGFEKIENGCYW